MKRKSAISPVKRMAGIRDRIACEMPCSNDEARFLLEQLDAALRVNAALLLSRHRAAEEGETCTKSTPQG